MTTKILLSVDPGTHSGLAIFKDGVLRYAETVTSDYPTDVVAKTLSIRRALQFVSDVTPNHKLTFVTETQFLKGNTPNRFKSVAQIIRNAACWITLARIQGWNVATPIWPATWQKQWGLKGKSEQRKTLSRNLVCKMYPNPRPVAGKLTDNVSDAILIGLYYMATQDNPPECIRQLANEHGKVQC